MKWQLALPLLVASFAPAQAQQATTHGGAPVVSPDGLHIAFLSNRTGAEELFVISTDGTGERQLTTTPDEKSALAWTADGQQILFSAFANDVSHLYAIDPDGTKQREIAKVPGRGPALCTGCRECVETVMVHRSPGTITGRRMENALPLRVGATPRVN